ncbi:MAG: 3-deoxy-manno-octulosonate cytidylyltransferase [Elusimicrobia bacterium]|nr:3-deoxy-manno-octulosonate cytidylyltransferase [Elusimicrobiota bacterium]
MDKNCLIVIPARYNSQRFPGKVLAKIAGKPVLQWCYEAAARAGLGEILIATEDYRVMAFAKSIGAKAVLTSSRCQSGTDRVFEAAGKTKKSFIINFQGDEPFMRAETLVKAFRQLARARDCSIGTACARIRDAADIKNPNCVKIAMNSKGRALYFSRAPIPFHHPLSELKNYPFYKHCGFYIYRRRSLARFVKLPASPLEKLERLEQLRALENGMGITVAEVRELGPAIDTPADLKAAEKYLRRQSQV